MFNVPCRLDRPLDSRVLVDMFVELQHSINE